MFTCFQVSHRNDQIKRLETDIKAVKRLAEENSRRVRSDASKQLAVGRGVHEDRRSQLQEGIAALSKQLQETVINNREKELELRKVCETVKRPVYVIA